MAEQGVKPVTAEYDNEMRGVLFPNENKRTSKSPDMTGKCQIGGKEYRLAAWTQRSRKGDRYLSVSVTDPDTQVAAEEAPKQDDLPF